MPIAKGNKKLVLEGFAAWLVELGLENSPDTAALFARQMTDNDAKDYEGMSQDEVRMVIEPF